MELSSIKEKLIDIFEQLSEIKMAKGEFFPSRAFRDAGRNIETASEFFIAGSRIGLYYTDSDRKVILGQSSSDIFIDVLKTGKSSRLESESIYKINHSDLKNISGLGEVKVGKLFEVGIYSAEDLRKLNLNVGDTIPGTNITYSNNIDVGLKFYLATKNRRITREQAYDYLVQFKNHLIKNQIYDSIEMYAVGSYRRHKPTVGDIDIIITNREDKILPQSTLGVIANWFDSIFVNGDTKIAGVKGETQVDVRIIDRKFLGAHILHGTGSQEFNIKMRAHAKYLGLKLNEYGIEKDGEMIYFEKEIDIFKYLRVPYIPPCER